MLECIETTIKYDQLWNRVNVSKVLLVDKNVYKIDYTAALNVDEPSVDVGCYNLSKDVTVFVFMPQPRLAYTLETGKMASLMQTRHNNIKKDVPKELHDYVYGDFLNVFREIYAVGYGL